MRPSWREESPDEEKENDKDKGKDKASADKEEKEENGTERKRFSPFLLLLQKGMQCSKRGFPPFVVVVLHSLPMFSSLAEVIEVAIRAEYQVGVKRGESPPDLSPRLEMFPMLTK